VAQKAKAVFLDRDGVVNELVYFQEKGVIDSPFIASQFQLCHGIIPAVKKFQNAGYKVIIASNQPGIAKGHITEENFAKIKETMKKQLKKGGAVLDGEYYCFHHTDAKIKQYKVDCKCRKPKPGLILQAAKDMNIDVSQSWFIGDNLTDIKAGKNAGCHTMLIGKMRCELCDLMDHQGVKPDVIKLNITEASEYILKGD
jgi:D-glycero-D-manno-heptose 1,7-bisphosphate phosphatase